MVSNSTTPIFTEDCTINCVNCRLEHTIEESQSFCTSCGHGSPLEINYNELSPLVQLPNYLFGMELSKPSSLVKLDHFSSLYDAEIYAKCENELPTGSFKYRGSVAEVATAKRLGYNTIACASTGNMGVSLAAECTRHHIKSVLFVPKTTPAPKLAAARKYGAEIKYVDGAYSDCELEASIYAQDSNAFLAGDYYLRAEGAKLVAPEILMQLDDQVPDIVIVPGGVGTNASAITKGFVEMAYGGRISKVPQLVVVQSEKCCPIIDSLEKGAKVVASSTSTLCSATAVADPYDYAKVKKYIDLTEGFGVRVSDEDSLIASKMLAEKESIDAELSGALPLTAIDQIKDHIIGKTVILFVTGAGYKDIHIQEEAYSKLLK